jgi:hypothetical protein
MYRPSVRQLPWLLVLVACGSSSGNATDPAKNPLGDGTSVLPFPSSLYEKADSGSPTGVLLDLPMGALPDASGSPFDPARLDKKTGWPSSMSILWAVPDGIDHAALIGYDALATSTADGGSTLLVDMTTGMRVAHFAEVDANVTDDLSRQVIYIRPAQRLTGGHRYAVGFRDTIHHADGSALAPTPEFRAVLDDKATGHKRLDAARPRLREAVAALEAAGLPREHQLVAWDFTVEDDNAAIADAVAARDAALAAAGTLGANLTYTVTSDAGTVNGDPRLVRRIDLDFQSPSVAGPKFDGFHRGADGKPVVMGMETAHAHIMVPPCATTSNKAGIIIFGHGFFGSLDEIRTSEHLRQLAADGCYVVAGTLWEGFTVNDQPNALLALNDLNQGYGFGERIWQGMVNSIMFEQLLRGKLATDLLGGIVDPSRVVYYGISNGHILGSTFVAYDPAITRAVLQVGGASWSQLFERSKNWAAFGAPLKGVYDERDQVIMQQVLDMQLELVDGATVAPGQVPDVPAKELFMQTSHTDCQVPTLGSFYPARPLGVPLITPSVVDVAGVPTAATATGRGWVIVDEDPTMKPPADNSTFAYDNEAHGNPRKRPAVQQMILDFFSTGMIHSTCTNGGACDCGAGNCGVLQQPMYGGS